MLKRLKDKRGSGYIDVVVIVLSAILVIALATSVFPVYIAKSQLSSFQGSRFPSENGNFQRPQGSCPPPCQGP